MTTFNVRLDDVHLVSTASRRGYWDEVLLTMSVERVKQDDSRVLVDMRVANLGYMGYGHTRALGAVPPLNGGNWEIQVPDLEDDDTDVVLAVMLHNIRGMPDQAKERLLAKIAAWSLTSAAEEAAEVASTVGKLAKMAWFGLAGMLIDATIDELLKDKPICLGLIMLNDRSIAPDQFGRWKFNDGGVQSADWISQAAGQLHGRPLPAPGPGCNVPSAEINFSVIKRTPLQFGPKMKWTKSYTELDWLKPEDITKTWLDDPFASQQRPCVIISKSTVPNKDSYDIQVIEKYYDPEAKATHIIQNRMFTDVMLSTMGLLVPGKEIYGVVNPLSIVKRSMAFAVPNFADLEMAAPVAKTGVAAMRATAFTHAKSVAATDPQDDDLPPMTVERITNPAKVMEAHVVQFTSAMSDAISNNDLTVLANLRETLVFALPDGLLLSFWRAYTKLDGVVAAEGIEMRYWRPDSFSATRTDCWMAPAAIFG